MPISTLEMGFQVPPSAVHPPGQGILQVDTSPVKGEVFLNGVSKGIAPITPVSLNAGTYTVSFGQVIGYTAPATQSAVITSDETTPIVGIYTIVEAGVIEKIQEWWNSLSILQKVLVVTGVSGSVILIASSGGRREQPIVVVTGGKKE